VLRSRTFWVSTLTLGLLAGPVFGQARLKTYETPYYIIHTDLDRNAVREARSRITSMAEMYHQRTKGFAGRITRKLPFYLFSGVKDYYAAGGLEGSAGVFTGDSLMAVAGQETSGATWRIIQHEGFHQFVHAVIGGDIPIWVNEGLAEYFGQALYTGDGYVTGLIPPRRLARLQQWIEGEQARPLDEVMMTSHAAWNAGLSIINYDQAWSMVHFLAHAENGRYQPAFNGFIKSVSRGMRWEDAWRKNFGTGTRAFEQKWRQYWTQMPPDATATRYVEATVATLTSFYARAFSQRQVFRSFADFEQAALAGQLKCHPEDWLPPRLLEDALLQHDDCGQWQVRKRTGRYELVCTMQDGTLLTGTFKVRSRRVVPTSVKVTIRKPRD
jgi:hypothetical protein